MVQWFVIDIMACGFIKSISYKNVYGDNDTIKAFKIQVSNHPDKYDNSAWTDVASFTSQKSNSQQSATGNLSSNTKKSRYWRFHVSSTYGGYTCLSTLSLTLSF